jgi:hypothetical protein
VADEKKQLMSKLESFQVLWYLFKGHKNRMLVVLLAMILSSLLESLNLVALYPIVNYGLKLEEGGAGLEFIENIIRIFPTANLFLASCILLIILTVIAFPTGSSCRWSPRIKKPSLINSLRPITGISSKINREN